MKGWQQGFLALEINYALNILSLTHVARAYTRLGCSPSGRHSFDALNACSLRRCAPLIMPA